MMKRLISLLLVLIFMFSFSACGNKEENKEDSTKPVVAEDATKDNAEAEEVAYEKGVCEDGVWTSKCLGLKFTCTEDYTFMTNDELKEAMNKGSEILEGDASSAAESYEAAGDDLYYEFAAVNVLTNSNVTVFAEKMKYSGITANQYLKATKKSLETMNAKITYSETTKYTVAGVDFDCIGYRLEAQGVSTNQLMLCKIVGDRCFVVTMTYNDEDGLNELVGCFTAVK